MMPCPCSSMGGHTGHYASVSFLLCVKGLRLMQSGMNFSIWNEKATVFLCQIKEKCLFGDTGFLEKVLNCQNHQPLRWFHPRCSDGRSSIRQLPSPESGVDSTISPQWQVRSSLTDLQQILFWGIVVKESFNFGFFALGVKFLFCSCMFSR